MIVLHSTENRQVAIHGVSIDRIMETDTGSSLVIMRDSNVTFDVVESIDEILQAVEDELKSYRDQDRSY